MAYSYYASVTIQNGKVADDHADFPILVSGTFDGTGGEADLRTTVNGGKIYNTDASGGISGAYTVPADFVFSPNTDGSSEYDFEIEKYDAATGEIVAWVEIPTMDADADLTFYMVYGDSGVANSQEDVNGTWNAGYKAVYHMAEASGNILDSVGNHNSTAVTNTPDYQQAGKAGYSINFDDPNKTDSDAESFGIPDHADFAFAADFSLEAWCNPDATDIYARLLYQYDSTTADGFYLSQNEDGNGKWEFTWFVGGTAKVCYSDGVPSGSFQHIAGIRASDIGTLYVDGVAQADTETLTGAIDSTDVVFIGSASGEQYGMSGYIDEVRISDVDRGANWITTTFNTINDVSTFLSFGTQVGLGGAKIIFF